MIHVDIRPPLAVVTLDRPQALHALDLAMIRALHAALRAAREDARVRAVILRATGDKAFCAGGDVRGVVLDHRAGGSLSRDFFREEYALNQDIAAFPKPWVSLWNGVVMGGGAGISVHGSHRVATERTVFAMPETAIGFFPDVGATYFLPRLPGEIGTWLALTGARLGAHDLLVAGLATHAVPAAALDAIVDELRAALASGDAHAAIDAVLARHPLAGARVVLDDDTRGTIARCFAATRVVDVVAALSREATPFATQAKSTLVAMSPTSLVATLALLRAGAGRTLPEALAAEYAAAQAFARGHDFHEGVRAMLIDKDKRPRWVPATLADVDEAAAAAF